MDGLDSILAGIVTIGKALGRDDAATSLTSRIKHELAQIENELAADPRSGQRPRVFISVERQWGSLSGIYSAGAGSFLDDALRLAGGINILGDVTQPYPQVSKEILLARQPEMILEFSTLAELRQSERRQLLADWQLLASIPAVRNGRIEILTDDSLLIPGPRFPHVVRTIKDVLYPR